MSKIKTALWYLKQPKGFSLFKNIVLGKTIYKRKEHSADKAIEWCSPKAVDTIKGLQQLFSKSSFLLKDPQKEYPDIFQEAEERVRHTPFQMGGAGNLILLYSICEKLQAKTVIETGVAYGWSSLSILLSLNNRTDSKLISTDMPYAKMGNEDFVGIAVPSSLHSLWQLYREADISALPKILKKVSHVDIIHYDSDKSYLGRMSSYPLLYERLRKGGIFISDDIQDNIAFKEFAQEINDDPIIIGFEGKYIGILVK